ncbi:hypothetical protein Bca4012_089201 [Brassica carinata]|uniref:Uncharacterized protein n=1 Tax=Brassica carinata TaxID=52824 RepID=A0A8X7P9D6_BRACI|nr:hypothetical protein Bca52824_087274 [Brassica carinata]
MYIYYILPNRSSSSALRFYFLFHRPPLGPFSCFKSMTSEKFGPHLPTIIEAKHIENLYELWGIDYAVKIEAPEDDETLETTEACHFLFLASFLRRLRSLGWLLPKWHLIYGATSWPRGSELGRRVSSLASRN